MARRVYGEVCAWRVHSEECAWRGVYTARCVHDEVVSNKVPGHVGRSSSSLKLHLLYKLIAFA